MAAGKTILVTGANAGIGLVLVRLLAEKGHLVYLGARNADQGRKAAEEFVSKGLNVKFVQIEVTSDPSVNAARDTIEAAEGRLDSLVNNAGITGPVPANDDSSEVNISAMQETIATNLIGTIRVCNAFLSLLRKASGTPTILNVSSELGSNAYRAARLVPLFYTPYSASKVALNSYTISLAGHLKESGFKVNVATPGLTSTKLTGNIGKPVLDGALALLPWIVLGEDGPNGKFFAEDGKSEFIW